MNFYAASYFMEELILDLNLPEPSPTQNIPQNKNEKIVDFSFDYDISNNGVVDHSIQED